MIGWETEIRGNTERSVKRLYDMNGNHVGTISISRPRKTSSSGKKKKSALYSFKQVSFQVLQAKTSTKAMQVSNSIRAKIGLLKKQLKNGDVDEEEVLRAILHAEMVMRACDKKKKNLKMEETAERNLAGEEEIPAEPEEPIEDAESDEEIRELLGIPDGYAVLNLVALGGKAESKRGYSEEDFDRSKIHYELF